MRSPWPSIGRVRVGKSVLVPRLTGTANWKFAALKNIGIIEMSADTEWTFLETVRELWAACGDRESWRSGLTERLMKRMVWLAGKGVPDFNQIMFESAMINYSRRQGNSG